MVPYIQKAYLSSYFHVLHHPDSEDTESKNKQESINTIIYSKYRFLTITDEVMFRNKAPGYNKAWYLRPHKLQRLKNLYHSLERLCIVSWHS